MHVDIQYYESSRDNPSFKRRKPMAAEGSCGSPRSTEQKKTFGLLFPAGSNGGLSRSNSKKLYTKSRRTILNDDVFSNPQLESGKNNNRRSSLSGQSPSRNMLVDHGGSEFSMIMDSDSCPDTPSPVRIYSNSSRGRARLRKKSIDRRFRTHEAGSVENLDVNSPRYADPVGSSTTKDTLDSSLADNSNEGVLTGSWSLSNMVHKALRGRSLTKKDLRRWNTLKKSRQSSESPIEHGLTNNSPADGEERGLFTLTDLQGKVIEDGSGSLRRRRNTLKKRRNTQGTFIEGHSSFTTLSETGVIVTIESSLDIEAISPVRAQDKNHALLNATPRSPKHHHSDLVSKPSIAWEDDLPVIDVTGVSARKIKFPSFLGLAISKFRGRVRRRQQKGYMKDANDTSQNSNERTISTEPKEPKDIELAIIRRPLCKVTQVDEGSSGSSSSDNTTSSYSTASSNDASSSILTSATTISEAGRTQVQEVQYMSLADEYITSLSRGIIYGDFCTPLYIPLTCLLGIPCPPELMRKMYKDRLRWVCIFSLAFICFSLIAYLLACDLASFDKADSGSFANANSFNTTWSSTTAAWSKIRILLLICVLGFSNFLCFVFSTQLDWAYGRRMTAILFPLRLLFV